MKVATIVGARPQFVKAAIVSKEIAALNDVTEVIIHTGQHYDQRMSQVFFEDLAIPRPKYNLQAGSGTHGRQTGLMLAKLEEVFETEQPDAVVVYGDTNSTLAGALAAAKMHIPIAHVEAGLRSFNRQMPEEVNRVVTDHISQLLLCPTDEAVRNIQNEGMEGAVLVGDVMYDAALYFSERTQAVVSPLIAYQLTPQGYVLMTCHRAENTDDPERLAAILSAADRIAGDLPVLFPIHPRTSKLIGKHQFAPNVKIVEPLSYLEMLALERDAAVILTDSGGVQKEAFFFGVPCVTMRDETEWVETIENGANVLVGADTERIVNSIRTQVSCRNEIPDAGQFYGQRNASARCAMLIAELAASRSPCAAV